MSLEIVSWLNNNGSAVTAFATVILVIITAHYAKSTKDMLNEQKKIMKKERLIKEMDKLVSPLKANIQEGDIFIKGAPGYKANNSVVIQNFFSFWDEIKRNKYLAPEYLRSALDDYLKNTSNTVGGNPDEPYKQAQKKLYDAIEKRYTELITELSALE